MASSIKQLFSHTFYYGLGNVISRGVTFLMLPLLTNVMEPTEYGKLGLVQTFIALVQVFLVCGMRPAIIRYSSKDSMHTRETVFSGGLLWVIIFTLPGIALLNISASGLMPFIGLTSQRTYQYMLIILLLDAISIPAFAFLQSAQRPRPFIIFKVLHVLIHFSGAYYLLMFGKVGGLDSVLMANIAASAAQIIFLAPLFLSKIRINIPLPLLKRMLAFGAPFIPNIIFVVIINVIDRALISHFMDIEQVGFYSAAAKLAMIMFLAVYAFQTAWPPFFLAHRKDPQGPLLFSRVFTYFLLGTCGIFLLVGLFYREIASISAFGTPLIGLPYRGGLGVIPPLLAAFLFSGIYSNFCVGIHIREKTRYFPFVAFVGAAVNVIGNLLLIPKMGIMGAAVSTLCAYTAMALIIFPISRRLFPIDYEWHRIAKLGLITCLLFFVGTHLESLPYRASGLLLFFPLLWVSRFFEKDETRRFKTLFLK